MINLNHSNFKKQSFISDFKPPSKLPAQNQPVKSAIPIQKSDSVHFSGQEQSTPVRSHYVLELEPYDNNKWGLLIEPEYKDNPFLKHAAEIVKTAAFKDAKYNFDKQTAESAEAKFVQTLLLGAFGAGGAVLAIPGGPMAAAIGGSLAGAASGPYSKDMTKAIMEKISEKPELLKKAEYARDIGLDMEHGTYQYHLKDKMLQLAEGKDNFYTEDSPVTILATAMISRYDSHQKKAREVLPYLRSSVHTHDLAHQFYDASEVVQDLTCDNYKGKHTAIADAIINMDEMVGHEEAVLSKNFDRCDERNKMFRHLERKLGKMGDYLHGE